MHPLFSTARPRLFAAAFALLLAPLSTHATTPTAPTAGTITPEQADRQWQQASARYASVRQALLQMVATGAARGPYRPDWASLRQYHVPAWYNDARFGIFIHWGLYAVPAFANEWYPRNMYDRSSREHAHQIASYGRRVATIGLTDDLLELVVGDDVQSIDRRDGRALPIGKAQARADYLFEQRARIPWHPD